MRHILILGLIAITVGILLLYRRQTEGFTQASITQPPPHIAEGSPNDGRQTDRWLYKSGWWLSTPAINFLRSTRATTTQIYDKGSTPTWLSLTARSILLPLYSRMSQAIYPNLIQPTGTEGSHMPRSLYLIDIDYIRIDALAPITSSGNDMAKVLPAVMYTIQSTAHDSIQHATRQFITGFLCGDTTLHSKLAPADGWTHPIFRGGIVVFMRPMYAQTADMLVHTLWNKVGTFGVDTDHVIKAINKADIVHDDARFWDVAGNEASTDLEMTPLSAKSPEKRDTLTERAWCRNPDRPLFPASAPVYKDAVNRRHELFAWDRWGVQQDDPRTTKMTGWGDHPNTSETAFFYPYQNPTVLEYIDPSAPSMFHLTYGNPKGTVNQRTPDFSSTSRSDAMSPIIGATAG